MGSFEECSTPYFSWEALSFMTSTVGSPVKLHTDTISCTDLEVAKVFVNVDVSKVLSKEITFLEEGKEYTVGFHYLWLPSRCNLCDKWGHVENLCVMKGKGKKPEGSGSQSRSKEKEEITKEKEIGLEQLRKNEVTNVMNIEKIVENQETIQAEVIAKKRRKGDTINQPLIVSPMKKKIVSPMKAGRHQTISPQRDVDNNQISASKYSVLSLDDVEDGKILGEERQNTELETNEEVNDEEVQTLELESDLLEDSILDKQVKEKDKAVMQKGMKRGQKAKAQDANPPKSTRSSRRKH